MTRGYLVLDDGTVMDGEPFGSRSDVFGEVIFFTGMGGYQETMTDPASRGHITVMAFPTIGNGGTCDQLNQSNGVHVRGLVVREYCKEPSKMYGDETIDEFMKKHNVPGLSGIDTRELVIKIRESGTLRGTICFGDADKALKDVKNKPLPSESNLVAEVSSKGIVNMDNKKELTVGLLDCGHKTSVISELSKLFNVVVLPYDTSAQKIIDLGVNGLLISDGPGDPAHPDIKRTAVAAVSDLSSKMPMMGIGLGDQIIGSALGAKTYKMKFGHHGCNQPVKYEGRVYITSQNHGFAVDPKTLDGTDLIADQFNVNDGTEEGMKHRDLPIITMQYHPDSYPGPCDTSFMFGRFGKMMEAFK